MFIRNTPEERPQPRIYAGWEGHPLVDLTPDDDNPAISSRPFNEDTYREFCLWWQDWMENSNDNEEDNHV